MHFRRKRAIAGSVLALALSTTQVVAAAAEPGAGLQTAPGARSVTLITGDTVVVAGKSSHAIRPAAGRAGIGFTTFTAGDHFYAIPSDAIRMVENGQLDRRLFDITTLLESGYDDASRSTLPLIVTYPDGQRAARPNVAVAGSTMTRDLASINGIALTEGKANATALWHSLTAGTSLARTAVTGVKKVWLDARHHATLDRSVPQIGAPAAWAAGFTGTGVTIAVLDTGVDQTHPDLAGREIAERNFSDAADNVDRFGHGTHVASIAAGTGAKSGGKFRGVADGASIVDGKVLDDSGFGQDSWIIAGMQWAADQGAKVANLSIGGTDSPGIDPLEEAVNTLSAQRGILFVIAAGNSGPRTASIDSPGSADAALTVGAVDRDDSIAFFSSRGPRLGDGGIKPDLTAPGVGIAAAKAANGVIGDPVADGYVALSGTSMATPHVAGSAALLAQQHPDWTGAQLKAALIASAKPTSGVSPYEQGAGRVDVAKVITQKVISEPANVSLGTVAWPHNDDQPVSKPLTYHNLGPTAVTMNLTVEATGPDGKPAPSGVFSLAANQITVPAGGQAEVALTGNTTAATVDGPYIGTIVASAGDASVRTPVAINREVESHDVTINAKGLDGQPTDAYSILLVGLDNDTFAFPFDPDGSVTLRLPKGQYSVVTFVDTKTPAGARHVNLLPYPVLSLTGDTTIDADARLAKPISVTPPDPSATPVLGDVGYEATGPAVGSFSISVLRDDPNTVSSANLGPAVPGNQVVAWVASQWTVPSGAFYGLAAFQTGAVPTGFTKAYRQKDLATVHADLAATAPGRTGWRTAYPIATVGQNAATAALLTLPLPAKRTEYYSTESTRWQTGMAQVFDDPFAPELTLDAEPQAYRAGHTYQARFNRGPFGPALPNRGFPWAERFGDSISAQVPMFGDVFGNAGRSATVSGNTKLFHNGQLVGEFPFPGVGFFDVPAAAADYRLTTEAVRDPRVFDVSTAISAAWTFRSEHADESNPALIPLSAIRFTPTLDESNAAPAGRLFVVPVAMQSATGARITPRQLRVDVSYDEGRTWRKADLVWDFAVLLHHPAGAGSVSLRASATDRDGNTVEQTIIRAYKLK